MDSPNFFFFATSVNWTRNRSLAPAEPIRFSSSRIQNYTEPTSFSSEVSSGACQLGSSGEEAIIIIMWKSWVRFAKRFQFPALWAHKDDTFWAPGDWVGPAHELWVDMLHALLGKITSSLFQDLQSSLSLSLRDQKHLAALSAWISVRGNREWNPTRQ